MIFRDPVVPIDRPGAHSPSRQRSTVFFIPGGERFGRNTLFWKCGGNPDAVWHPGGDSMPFENVLLGIGGFPLPSGNSVRPAGVFHNRPHQTVDGVRGGLDGGFVAAVSKGS